MGRVDDVINVSEHRLGTMEVEAALVAHPKKAEAAALGRPDYARRCDRLQAMQSLSDRS